MTRVVPQRHKKSKNMPTPSKYKDKLMTFCSKYEYETPTEQKLSSNFSLAALTNEPQELTKLNFV